MENAKYKRLPSCLKRYRKARGLKQKEVVKILGLKSISMLSRWERGVCLPKPINMLKLAILYRTTVGALFIDLRRTLFDEIRKKEEKIFGSIKKENNGREVKN